MALRVRLCGLVLFLAMLPIGPTQSQDILQTLRSIVNESALINPRNPIVLPEGDAEVLQVQKQLAARGYDVGTPDGVMGQLTRKAVAAYQQSIGTLPTGILTSAELDSLLSGGVRIAAPTSPTPNGRLDFDLLYDVDLPGNDFRSGMNETSLKGLTLDLCLAACAGDGRCQAFTYNARAKMCFLKAAGSNPSMFGGAISGLRNGVGGAAGPLSIAVDPAGQRPLLPAEVAQLQAGLNRRGYDAGTPDGVMGGKTRAAIVRFLADHPGGASQSINVALMQAVLGQPATPSAPTAIDAASYRTFEEIDRDLSLIALAKDPTILDDTGFLRSWFSRDARSAAFGDDFALITKYDKGNSVERDVILTRYRQTLLEEAAAFVADPANLKFQVRVTDLARLGAFEPGKGLIVRPGRLDVIEEKRLVHRVILARTVFGGLALEAPDIRYIPLSDESAAAALLGAIDARSGNHTGNITVWLTISEVGIDRNAVGTPLTVDIPMTVSVDGVSLMTYSRDGKSPDEELLPLYRSTDIRPASVVPTDNLMVAASLNLPLIDGHVAMPASRGSNDQSWLGNLLTAGYEYSNNMARFWNLAAIRLAPERSGSWTTERDMRNLMTQGQHLRVYGGSFGAFGGFDNEFSRRQALDVFNSEVLPELVEVAPSLPIRVVSIGRAELGEYDFATGSFPVTYADSHLFGLPPNLGQIRSTARYQNLPPTLAIDEAAAEALVRNTTNGHPVFFVATFGTLSLPPDGALVRRANYNQSIEESSRSALVFTPSHAGIFLDATLLVKLVELDPAMVVHDPDGPTLPRVPSASEIALDHIVVATEVELLGRAYDFIVAQGKVDSIIDSHRDVRVANEFTVQTRRQEVEAALVNAARRPVWLKGIITFGAYNIEALQFEAAQVRFYSPDDSGFSANYHYSLVDPRQLADLPVSADQARQIVETSSREMGLLAQVELVDITTDANGQTPTYGIALDIKEMLILTSARNTSEPQTLIARIRPAANGSDAVARFGSVPPLRQLDSEALDYLRIKYAPETMDGVAYERMMSARWAMENVNWVPNEEHFFPAGTDLLSAAVRQRWLPDFKLWAQSRVASLSAPLRLACANPIGGGDWTSPIRDPALDVLPELASATSIGRIAARYATPHPTGPVYFEIPGYLMEAEVCGNGVAPTPLINALGLKAMVRSGAVIKVDNVAMPGTNASGGKDIALDLIVDSVEVLPHPGGGKVALLIKARFDSAWYAGNPPVEATNHRDLEALTAEADTGTVVPDGWDIVGLRPGQTLEQADTIIREHMQVAVVHERQQGQRGTPYLNNEISYLDAALSEAITLIYEPTTAGDIVFLIARQIGRPANTMPTDDILAGLRAKYGIERRVDLGIPGQFTVNWHSQETPKSSRGQSDLQHCGIPFVMAQGNWSPIEGSVEAVDPGIVGNIQVRGYLVLPGTSDLHPDILELGALDCGIAVMANKHLSGNNDALMVQIFDYAGYAKAYEAAQQLGRRAVVVGADAESEAPSLDIKF